MYGDLIVQKSQAVNQVDHRPGHESQTVPDVGLNGEVQISMTKVERGGTEGGGQKDFEEVKESLNVSTNRIFRSSSGARDAGRYQVFPLDFINKTNLMGGFTHVEGQKIGSMALSLGGERESQSRSKLQFQQPRESPEQLPLPSGFVSTQPLNQPQLRRSAIRNFRNLQQQKITQNYQILNQQQYPQLKGSTSERSTISSLHGVRNNQTPYYRPEMLLPRSQRLQEFPEDEQLQQPQNPTKRKAQRGLQPSKNSHAPLTKIQKGYAKRHCASVSLPVVPVDISIPHEWEGSDSSSNLGGYQQVPQDIHSSENLLFNTPQPWNSGTYDSVPGPPSPEISTPQHMLEKTPYFHYSPEFMKTERARLDERVIVEDVIVANMKAFNLKKLGSKAPEALGHLQCQNLYQNTLKQEMETYQDEMSKYQRKSKALLELMARDDFLGSAQFWPLVSQRLRELGGEE